MKRILGVALLLMSFASVALADGSGLPPVKSTQPQTSVDQLADGSGLPPVKSTQPQANVDQLADGSGLPPVKSRALLDGSVKV